MQPKSHVHPANPHFREWGRLLPYRPAKPRALVHFYTLWLWPLVVSEAPGTSSLIRGALGGTPAAVCSGGYRRPAAVLTLYSQTCCKHPQQDSRNPALQSLLDWAELGAPSGGGWTRHSRSLPGEGSRSGADWGWSGAHGLTCVTARGQMRVPLGSGVLGAAERNGAKALGVPLSAQALGSQSCGFGILPHPFQSPPG